MQLVAGSAVLAGNVTTGSNSSSAAAVVSPNTATRAGLLNVTAAALASLISLAQGDEGSGAPATTLDDATLGAVALTIRSLSLDPFEVNAGAAGSTVASLTVLLQAALSGSANVTAAGAAAARGRRRLATAAGRSAQSAAVQLAPQVGQAVLDGLLNAAMSGHIRSAAARGADVLVGGEPRGSDAVLSIAFGAGQPPPPLPRSEVAPLRASFRALTAALLRSAAPGTRPVSIVSGVGSIAWPPLGNASAWSANASSTRSFLCSPAYSMTVARYAAPADGGAGAFTNVGSPLPPCGYRVGGSPSLQAPPAGASFPPALWARIAAAAAARSSSPLALPTLDATLLQWGADPVPGAAGWVGSNAGPGINVTALNEAAVAAAAGREGGTARRLATELGVPDGEVRAWLRRAADETAASSSSSAASAASAAGPLPPQPCSGSLASSVNAGQIFPRLSPAQQQRSVDSPVISATLATSDGTAISEWAAAPDAFVNISIPFLTASTGTPQGDAPLAGLAALEVCRVGGWRTGGSGCSNGSNPLISSPDLPLHLPFRRPSPPLSSPSAAPTPRLGRLVPSSVPSSQPASPPPRRRQAGTRQRGLPPCALRWMLRGPSPPGMPSTR